MVTLIALALLLWAGSRLLRTSPSTCAVYRIAQINLAVTALWNLFLQGGGGEEQQQCAAVVMALAILIANMVDRRRKIRPPTIHRLIRG